MSDAGTERAFLAIADVSGYTNYLAGVELDHAQDILSDLTVTVVEAMAPFAYVPAESIDGSVLQDCIEGTYIAFRNRLRDIGRASTCECNACTRILTSTAMDVTHLATLLPDGRVLVVGGSSVDFDDGRVSLSKAEVWDPATSAFSPAGSFPGASRGMNTVTALADGRALIAGGCAYRETCYDNYDNYDNFASAEVWDPATETFGPTGSLAVIRIGHTVTALPDGRVLVVGGMEDYNLEGTVHASAEVWEPSDG